MKRSERIGSMLVLHVVLPFAATSLASDLTVDLGQSKGVSLVGAINRWDADGNQRRPVDPKARIEAPAVDARAVQEGNRFVFHDLPAGRYDLVVLADGQVRIEGFHYPPVLEFDEVLPPDSAVPPDTREWVANDIARSKHYENKVRPLFFAGDEKQVRVLVQLLRDKPTSFDAEFGARVATLRHEVWQYTNRYGGWVKEKKTKVLDRIIMAKDSLRRWTWVWEPALGGIELGDKPVNLSFQVPERFDPEAARGLLP